MKNLIIILSLFIGSLASAQYKQFSHVFTKTSVVENNEIIATTPQRTIIYFNYNDGAFIKIFNPDIEVILKVIEQKKYTTHSDIFVVNRNGSKLIIRIIDNSMFISDGETIILFSN